MSENPQPTTELYGGLQKKCRHAGTSIRQLCVQSGVSYQTVTGWKRKTPNSIEMLMALQSTLDSILKNMDDEKK